MTTQLQIDPTRFSAAAATGLRVFPVLARGKKPALSWTDYTEREPSSDELQAARPPSTRSPRRSKRDRQD